VSKRNAILIAASAFLLAALLLWTVLRSLAIGHVRLLVAQLLLTVVAMGYEVFMLRAVRRALATGGRISITVSVINAFVEAQIPTLTMVILIRNEVLSPYQVLVVASLVQRESKPQDFAKVARVIYNRLAEHRKLEFDSTVNYPLDRREVATTDGDRAQTTPWNTYAIDGLPATPICSPGTDALRAAEHPEDGDWLYFVTIDTQGTTLFTRDYQQHLANIELAKRNGVLDSAR